MKDRESIILVFLAIGLTLLIVGSFYRKWNLYEKIKPRSSVAKFLREIIGESGSQFLILFLSFIFLLPTSYLSYLQYIKPKLPAEYSQKTSTIALRSISNRDTKKAVDGWITGATITFTTIKNIEKSLTYSNLDAFDSISFRDNYLSDVPDFVWDMKNLKILIDYP